tara:strand:- start:52903 stop:54849 length:1947 start_codon:yes stop_codon:yes gene_type:complete
MAENTGPDENTYQIPKVALGDTFNTWRDTTNTAIYKLNKLKIYDGDSSGSISITTTTGGTASVALLETITTGHTFAGKINFSDVVTFNGSTVTMNAQTVTIDDYNIVLGDTAGVTDALIGAAGGGGLILNRGSGATAEWLWQNTGVHGVTGVWRANSHIGFSGATSGLYPADGGTLPVHGLAIRLDGGATTDHGLNISLTNTGGAAGATTNRAIEFSRYSPTGATVFMEVLNGTTYGAQPFVNIRNGANRKRVRQLAHGLSFGTPVYVNGTGLYTPADCLSVDKAEVVGVVSNRVDADNFEITFIGEVFGNWADATLAGSSTLATGGVYYLSSIAGKLNTSPSTTAATVHKAVLIATSSTSAVVVPFTGGLLVEDVSVATATTVGSTITQYNKFKVGYALRFVAGSQGLSYAYTNVAGNTYTNYPTGIYVKAQADGLSAAEVIGIVTDVKPIVVSGVCTGVNYQFTMATNGYIYSINGISATNATIHGNMVAGVQYFLNSGCAGTTQALDDNTNPSFTDTPPTTVGYVRKPIAFSVSTNSAQLITYRGDVNNAGQSSFTGYIGASADYIDLPTGSIVMGTTGSTLSPNVGVTLYYHNSGGLSGEYGVYLGASPTGITMNGTWKTRGRAIDRGTATGATTAYHLCQRIS